MDTNKYKIGIVFGGVANNRQSSLHSARYLYELLLEIPNYTPELLFLDIGRDQAFYKIPVHLLYKDNVDDIRDNIVQWEQTDTPHITSGDLPIRIGSDQLNKLVDFVWITLQERPGVDGQLQMNLEGKGIAYNSSDISVMNLLFHEDRMHAFMADNEFKTRPEFMVKKETYEAQVVQMVESLEGQLSYPLLAREAEGHALLSTNEINDRKQLLEWLDIVFRDSESVSDKEKQKWGLLDKPELEAFRLKEAASAKAELFCTSFVVGIYTLQLENGQVGYEFSKLMMQQGKDFVPVNIQGEGVDQEAVLTQVNIELERLSRLLNLKGYGLFNGQVNVKEDGKAEIIIDQIDSLPFLTQDSPFVNLVWQNKETSSTIVDKIITFGRQRADNKVNIVPEKVVMESEKMEDAQIKQKVVAPVEVIEEGRSIEVEAQGINGDVPKQSFWKLLLEFIKSKTFLKNVGGILGALIVCFVILNLWMRSYTRHNDFIIVNDYTGLNIDDGIAKAKSQGLEMVILEKRFESGATPNEIYQQSPKENMHIKEGRKIYVNIYKESTLEFELPSTVGNDNYELYAKGLRKHPFKLHTVIREKKFNAKLADQTILYMYYNDEKIMPADLKKGVNAMQGGTIEFVVTTRFSNYANVPDIVCQRFDAVEFLLSSSDLKMGAVVGGKDGFVIRQEPTAGKRLIKGSVVKVFTGPSKPEKCKE